IEIVEDLQDLIDLRDLEDARHLRLRRQQDELALPRHLGLRASDERAEAERAEELHQRKVHDDEGLTRSGDARELQVDLLAPFHVHASHEAHAPDPVFKVLVGQLHFGSPFVDWIRNSAKSKEKAKGRFEKPELESRSWNERIRRDRRESDLDRV